MDISVLLIGSRSASRRLDPGLVSACGDMLFLLASYTAASWAPPSAELPGDGALFLVVCVAPLVCLATGVKHTVTD